MFGPNSESTVYLNKPSRSKHNDELHYQTPNFKPGDIVWVRDFCGTYK